jgi:hypothetical protein
MLMLVLVAPLFLVFEIWQLVLSERYLGIKQISRGTDPRNLGLSEITACLWSLTLIGYWLWMVMMLFVPFGRASALGLLIVTTIGFSMRRGAPLKWVLVILTFEGAIRVGLLFALGAMAWRKF